MIKIEGTWLDEKRTLRIEDRGPEVMLEINGSGIIRVSRQELIQKLWPDGVAAVMGALDQPETPEAYEAMIARLQTAKATLGIRP